MATDVSRDPNAVERAVRKTKKHLDQWPDLDTVHLERVDIRTLCTAAARAAELESENEVLREQNIELNDGCVALERERDAAMARIGELEQQSEHWEASFNGSTAEIERLQEVERELAEAQDYIEKVLHRCGEFSAERDAALARVGEVERELTEAKEEQRRVWADGQKAVDSARRERDQLRAELDSAVGRLTAEREAHRKMELSLAGRPDGVLYDGFEARRQLAGQVSALLDENRALRTRLAAAEGALRPFAEIADRYEEATREPFSTSKQYGTCTIEMCRTARAALPPSTGEPFTRGFGALPPEEEQ